MLERRYGSLIIFKKLFIIKLKIVAEINLEILKSQKNTTKLRRLGSTMLHD